MLLNAQSTAKVISGRLSERERERETERTPHRSQATNPSLPTIQIDEKVIHSKDQSVRAYVKLVRRQKSHLMLPQTRPPALSPPPPSPRHPTSCRRLAATLEDDGEGMEQNCSTNFNKCRYSLRATVGRHVPTTRERKKWCGLKYCPGQSKDYLFTYLLKAYMVIAQSTRTGSCHLRAFH